MKLNRYLTMAKKASHKSDHHTHKMGCVIAKGNKVLGTGHNMMKTHTKSPHAWKFIHAEFMAVLNAGYDVKGATVYIFRAHKDATHSIARPCEYCWKFLMDLGVKEVVYTYEGNIKQERVA